MARDGAVRRFELVRSRRRNEHRSHHGERTERRRHHIAHDVAVIVLERPDEAALGAHDASDRVVDEGVEILYPRRFELLFVLRLVDLRENVLEGVVVDLGNGVLGGEPQVRLGVERVIEATAREALYARLRVVDRLQDALLAAEVEHGEGVAVAAQLRLAALRLHLHALVYVAVRVTGNDDRLLPAGHERSYAAHDDGRTEHRTVHLGTDGRVGARPHLLQPEFLHALRVGGYGGALHAHAEPEARFRRVHGHLVVRRVAVLEREVVILRLEIHIRSDEDVLHPLPQHARHFVPVDLDERCVHLDFIHVSPRNMLDDTTSPPRLASAVNFIFDVLFLFP